VAEVAVIVGFAVAAEVADGTVITHVAVFPPEFVLTVIVAVPVAFAKTSP
jgi:hypothetical protein